MFIDNKKNSKHVHTHNIFKNKKTLSSFIKGPMQ